MCPKYSNHGLKEMTNNMIKRSRQDLGATKTMQINEFCVNASVHVNDIDNREINIHWIMNTDNTQFYKSVI